MVHSTIAGILYVFVILVGRVEFLLTRIVVALQVSYHQHSHILEKDEQYAIVKHCLEQYGWYVFL